MHGRVLFRDASACVTSTELMIGNRSFPLSEIVDASAERRRLFFFFPRYFLIIATRRGERTVLCHRNGYLVFQLLKALEMALRETNRVVRSSTQPDRKSTRLNSSHG